MCDVADPLVSGGFSGFSLTPGESAQRPPAVQNDTTPAEIRVIIEDVESRYGDNPRLQVEVQTQPTAACIEHVGQPQLPPSVCDATQCEATAAHLERALVHLTDIFRNHPVSNDVWLRLDDAAHNIRKAAGAPHDSFPLGTPDQRAKP